MFKAWLSWLEEVSTEITTEAKVEELSSRKKDLRCEICNLQYEVHRFYSLYSQASLALSKARYNYEIIEYRLACVDGRLNVYKAAEAEKSKDRNIKDMLSQMSAVDRQRLLAELEGLED